MKPLLLLLVVGEILVWLPLISGTTEATRTDYVTTILAALGFPALLLLLVFLRSSGRRR